MNLIVGNELMLFFSSPDINLGSIKEKLSFLHFCPNYQYASLDMLVCLFAIYRKVNNIQTCINHDMRKYLRNQLLSLIHIGSEHSLQQLVATNDHNDNQNQNGDQNQNQGQSQSRDELIKQEVTNAIHAVNDPNFHYTSYCQHIINVNNVNVDTFYPMLITVCCSHNPRSINCYMEQDEILVKGYIEYIH